MVTLLAVLSSWLVAGAARAELLPYRANSLDPEWSEYSAAPIRYIDTDEADFVGHYAYSGGTEHWGNSGRYTVYSYKDRGAFVVDSEQPTKARLIGCGVLGIEQCRWKVDARAAVPANTEDNRGYCQSIMIGQKRTVLRKSLSVSCGQATSIARSGIAGKKLPRNWSCRRKQGKLNCRGGKLFVNAEIFSAEDQREWNWAKSHAIAYCGVMDFGFYPGSVRLGRHVYGDCNRASSGEFIAVYGQALTSHIVPSECSGPWGNMQCEDGDSCLMVGSPEGISAWLDNGNDVRWYYKTADYQGC